MNISPYYLRPNPSLDMKKYLADDIIKKFDLQSHDGGGYFKETFRAPKEIQVDWDESMKRNMFTSCYYLARKTANILFHRIKSDEIWNYHSGLPMHCVLIRPGQDSSDPQGYQLIEMSMGFDIDKNQEPQFIVPAGSWFAGYPLHPENKLCDIKADQTASEDLDDYVFFGCSVAPGFDFKDFEVGHYDDMKSFFKDRKDILPVVEKLGTKN